MSEKKKSVLCAFHHKTAPSGRDTLGGRCFRDQAHHKMFDSRGIISASGNCVGHHIHGPIEKRHRLSECALAMCTELVTLPCCEIPPFFFL